MIIMLKAKTIITSTADEREQLPNVVHPRTAPLILLTAEGMTDPAIRQEVRLS
jgi:hypothetical protein